MSIVEQKLQRLGITLGPPKAPVGKYLGCKQASDLLFISGRVSDLRGEVGTEVTAADARQAARDTVVVILSIIKHEIVDLDRIAGVLKVQGFIRSSPMFTEHPHVLDGASELLIEVFGEPGQHARTATGVVQLPFGAAIQLDMIFQLRAPTE